MISPEPTPKYIYLVRRIEWSLIKEASDFQRVLGGLVSRHRVKRVIEREHEGQQYLIEGLTWNGNNSLDSWDPNVFTRETPAYAEAAHRLSAALQTLESRAAAVQAAQAALSGQQEVEYDIMTHQLQPLLPAVPRGSTVWRVSEIQWGRIEGNDLNPHDLVKGYYVVHSHWLPGEPRDYTLDSVGQPTLRLYGVTDNVYSDYGEAYRAALRDIEATLQTCQRRVETLKRALVPTT